MITFKDLGLKVREIYSNTAIDEFVPLTCLDHRITKKYEINGLGEIRDIKMDRVIKRASDGNKVFCSGGKTFSYRVSELVRMTFFPRTLADRKYDLPGDCFDHGRPAYQVSISDSACSYLKSTGIKSPTKLRFVSSPYLPGDLMISKEGLFYNPSTNNILAGTSQGRGDTSLTLILSYKKKSYNVKKMIRQVFGGDPWESKKGGTRLPVTMYDKLGNHVRSFKSIKEAALSLNLDPATIRSCCTGDQRRYGDYFWAFTEDEGSRDKIQNDLSRNLVKIDPGTGKVLDIFAKRKDITGGSALENIKLRDAIKSGRVYKGYLYKFYDEISRLVP